MLRPLGTFERALFISDRHSPFNIIAVLQMENPPAAEVVRAALIEMQARHPFLRACISNGCFEMTSSPLRFEVVNADWLSLVSREMNMRLDPRENLFRCFYNDSPQHASLVLTFNHTIIDAASGMQLLDELLRLCSDGLHTEERSTRLKVLPPAEQRFPASFKGLPGMVRTAWYGMTQMAEQMHYQWKVRGKRKPVIHLGGRGFPLTTTIPEPLVDRLSRHCRAEKVTLNSLLSAALLLACNRLLYGGDSRLMQTVAFADLRPYTVPPTSPEHLGNYISMLSYALAVSGSEDIWSVAKELHAKIHRSFKRGHKFTAFKMSENLLKMVTRMQAMRMGATALTYGGAVPLSTQYGGIKVTGLHAFLSSFDLGPEVSAQALLFNHELVLDFMFLETDMDSGQAERIVGEVRAILEAAATG